MSRRPGSKRESGNESDSTFNTTSKTPSTCTANEITLLNREHPSNFATINTLVDVASKGCSDLDSKIP